MSIKGARQTEKDLSNGGRVTPIIPGGTSLRKERKIAQRKGVSLEKKACKRKITAAKPSGFIAWRGGNTSKSLFLEGTGKKGKEVNEKASPVAGERRKKNPQLIAEWTV